MEVAIDSRTFVSFEIVHALIWCIQIKTSSKFLSDWDSEREMMFLALVHGGTVAWGYQNHCYPCYYYRLIIFIV